MPPQRPDEIGRNRATADRATSQAKSYSEAWLGNAFANPDLLPIGSELRLNDCFELVNLQDDKIYKAPVQTLGECPAENNTELMSFATSLHQIACDLQTLAREKKDTDRRYHRAHLCTEEVAEFVEAIAEQDELKALNALADLIVVTLGSGGRMRLPVSAEFLEVMRSNFTKAAQSDDPNAFRIREKGAAYEPPRTDQIFQMHAGRPPYSANNSTDSLVTDGTDG